MIPSNLPNRPLSRDELLTVIRDNHNLPGMYRITIIARAGSAFYATLHLLLEELQGESTFSIEEKVSSKKNYSSYRIELFVESAETALYRRERISELEGVLLLL
jgi:putative lipoic acid-binding regulatory protein